MQALDVLGPEPNPKRLIHLLPQLVEIVRTRCAELQAGSVPFEQLIVTQILSRELKEYQVSSALCTAATQLQDAGKKMSMGQIVRYIHTRGKPGVYAWDLPIPPKSNMINTLHYKDLVLRAIWEVVQPLGVTECLLKDWILGKASYIHVADFPKLRDLRFDSELPLFAKLNSLEKKMIQIV